VFIITQIRGDRHVKEIETRRGAGLDRYSLIFLANARLWPLNQGQETRGFRPNIYGSRSQFKLVLKCGGRAIQQMALAIA
jgi:hypothetical protein